MKASSSSDLDVRIPVLGWLDLHKLAVFSLLIQTSAGNLFLVLKFAQPLIASSFKSLGTNTVSG
jgi:hypothetical protein